MRWWVGEKNVAFANMQVGERMVDGGGVESLKKCKHSEGAGAGACRVGSRSTLQKPNCASAESS